MADIITYLILIESVVTIIFRLIIYALMFAYVVALMIPGEQPEKSIHSVIDVMLNFLEFTSKISSKQK